MKNMSIMKNLRIIAAAGILVLIGSTGGAAKNINTAESRAADSLRAYPEKVPSKSAWEKTVSLPGTVVGLPFAVFFKGIGKIVSEIEESSLVPKTKRMFSMNEGRIGLYPIYESRSGAGLKLYIRNVFTDGSKLSASLAAGLRSRKRYQVKIKNLRIGGGAVEITARYRLMSDERFFGLGSDTVEEDQSNYAHEQTMVEASYLHDIMPNTSIGIRLGMDRNNIKAGKNSQYKSTTALYDSKELPGIEPGTNMIRLQTSLLYDTRNRLGNPSSGFEIETRGGIYSGLDGGRFGFWTISADIKRYIHLFYNRVLVLRIVVETSDPISGKEIPFYYLSEMGSSSTVRGFKRGRFRDRDMIVGSAEYRYPVWHLIDALLFVDGGKVTSSLSNNISSDDLEWTYGGGLRVWNKKGVIMRFVIGKSDEQYRLLFKLN